jgi:hypothetical protein
MINVKQESKGSSVTGRESLNLLDSHFTDSGRVVSLACRPRITPRKITGTRFC